MKDAYRPLSLVTWEEKYLRFLEAFRKPGGLWKASTTLPQSGLEGFCKRPPGLLGGSWEGPWVSGQGPEKRFFVFFVVCPGSQNLVLKFARRGGPGPQTPQDPSWKNQVASSGGRIWALG